MAYQRRILVIGAGSSGLAAIKSCKEELLDVTCYEKTKYFGGRWRYSEQYIPGLASVMKSTVSISSKEMEAFSDFPPPNEFPNYLHHTNVLMYLTLYAEKFDLLRYIKYQREVIRITPSSEYKNNGKWLVTSVNRFNNSEVSEEFDAVFVCTGRLSEPVLPSFNNLNAFNGSVQHSQSLRTARAFEDLTVLVVGNGNSAVDAAVEISTVARQVYLSTRNGFWVFPKVGSKGLPYDMQLLRRDSHFLKNMCRDVVNSYVEKFLDSKLNHDAYKIKPSHRALDRSPTVNDDLPDKILTGRVIIKGKVSEFQKNGVIFEGENDITELDTVIFATGYTAKLPLIEPEISQSSDLYKWVFPIELKHPTLAFVGFVRINGPQIPVAESQSRWAARIFARKLNLPSKEAMDRYMVIQSQSKKSSGISIDYIDYMDELAEEYGVKPNMCSLLFKDSKLFWACFTGPFLSYQYRLIGPNNLNDAREIILNYEQRVRDSFNTKNSSKKYIKHENS